MTSLKVALPCLIISSALPCQTLVPCEIPEIITKSEKVLGLVSSKIPLTNPVPNSGNTYCEIRYMYLKNSHRQNTCS